MNEYYVGGISVGDPMMSGRAIWLEAGRKYPVEIKLTTALGLADPAQGSNDLSPNCYGVNWLWAEPETNAYVGKNCASLGPGTRVSTDNCPVGFEVVPTSQLDPP